MFARVGLVAVALLAQAQAHMQLYSPAPFMAYNNPHTPKGQADDELLFPYDCCGEKTVYPCRGYLDLLGTPAGASVATWQAGSTQHMQMVGPAPLGGNHYGGSCQVSFSIDKGKTFRVAKSWEGDCPLRNNGELDPSKQDFPFTVPADLPAGDAVFAWTWINREQEFFMNCAAVSITGNATSAGASGTAKSSSSTASKSSTSLLSRPASSSTKATGSSSSNTKPTSPSSSSPKASSTAASTVSNRGAVVSTPAATSAPVQMFSYAMEDDCVCTCPSLRVADNGVASLTGCSCVCENTPDVTKTGSGASKATAAPASDNGTDDDDDDDGSAASTSSSSRRRHRYSYTRNRLLARATSAPHAIEERAAAAAAFVPFSSRPLVFVGNINGCMTPKTNWELKYPNPGPDVKTGDGEYKLKLPTGTC